jgi:hypothetical protein
MAIASIACHFHSMLHHFWSDMHCWLWLMRCQTSGPGGAMEVSWLLTGLCQLVILVLGCCWQDAALIGTVLTYTRTITHLGLRASPTTAPCNYTPASLPYMFAIMIVWHWGSEDRQQPAMRIQDWLWPALHVIFIACCTTFEAIRSVVSILR